MEDVVTQKIKDFDGTVTKVKINNEGNFKAMYIKQNGKKVGIHIDTEANEMLIAGVNINESTIKLLKEFINQI